MTFYLALDAWVHWFSAYGKFENGPRALDNAIPFAVFLTLGVLRTSRPQITTAPIENG